eukprot:8679073-Alexandrium_andersonii.AAC.1
MTVRVCAVRTCVGGNVLVQLAARRSPAHAWASSRALADDRQPANGTVLINAVRCVRRCALLAR